MSNDTSAIGAVGQNAETAPITITRYAAQAGVRQRAKLDADMKRAAAMPIQDTVSFSSSNTANKAVSGNWMDRVKERAKTIVSRMNDRENGSGSNRSGK